VACLLLLVLPCLPPFAAANPQGGAVRQGRVQFQQSRGQLKIHQQSQRAVIDWESFSIARGETTRFLQPNSSAAALNRVRGASASEIEGMLRANGKVYLINPNGILIGPGGTIDVGGFVASTLDTGDDQFMKGGDLRFSGNSDAAVINLGSISALDGDVVLMGASVLNAGTIRAPRGTAALAAGNDTLLAESGEERVFVRGASGGKKAEGVTNTGKIEANIAELKAHGGNIYGIAVKNEGRVAATGVSREGGQIFLRAGGGKVRSTGTLKAKRSDGSGGRVTVDSGRTESRTEIGGTVDASGGTGAGGEITILGNEIEIFDEALILNDGATSGGTTRIGGGLRGQDPEFANSETIKVGNGALISANARDSGDGGKIIVFAADALDFRGLLSARGAGLGGNGGFAELSGRDSVNLPGLAGRIDLTAPGGSAGTLLYDPINISILAGTGATIAGSPVSQNTLYAGDIAAFLGSANLIVTTSSEGTDSGNITMDGAANITWSSANSLSFLADNDFVMDPGAVIRADGSGAFSVTATRSILLGNGSTIQTTGGDLTLSANASGTTTGNFKGVNLAGATVGSLGAGNVSLSGRGGNSGGNNYGVSIDSGSQVIGGTAGFLVINGTGGGSGSSSLSVGVLVSGGTTLVSSLGGNVEITGTGGSSLSADTSPGIFVSGAATITSGPGGSVTLTGTGSPGANYNNRGVWVAGPVVGVPTTISTGTGGNLRIVGTGGNNPSSLGNYGVDFDGGNGPVIIHSNGGTVTVIGTAGTAPGTYGININGIVSTTTGAEIDLITDNLNFGSLGSVNSGAGATNLRPLTSGFAIDLGGADVTGTTLGLGSVGELDRITAGLLRIGNANTGQITVSNAINYNNHLSLTTGAGVTINNAISMAVNKSLTINALGTATGTINLANANADLSATGTGEISLSTVRNILMSSGASIISSAGSITLSANEPGSTLGIFDGISIENASITSTTGNIFLRGNGGDYAFSGGGIEIMNGSLVGSSGGTIDLEGSDILIDLSSITNSGTGTINIDAVRSLEIWNDSILSVVDGGLTLNANVGFPLIGDFTGITIEASSLLTTGIGEIALAGRGGNSDSSKPNGSDGIRLLYGAVLSSTGTMSNAGSITLHGTAGDGYYGFQGIYMVGSTTSITSVDGAISLTGLGGDAENYNGGNGILMEGDATIHSTGVAPNAATITLHGTGGGIGSYNSGIFIRDYSTGIHSAYGDILLTGIGGGDGDGQSNHGIRLQNIFDTIASTGTGPNAAEITLYGTGGGGLSDNDGISMLGEVTISSIDGAILLTGLGGSGADGDHQGIFASDAVSITSTGLASITLNGTGGILGNFNHGIRLQGGAEVSSVGAGDLTLTGTVGAGANGFGVTISDAFATGATARSTSTGDITIVTDSFDLSATESVNAGANRVILRPLTNGTSIDLGGGDVIGTTLGLSDAELDRITAGLLQIGNIDSGAITVSAAISPANVGTLSLTTGAGIGGAGPITVPKLALSAVSGIGSSLVALNTAVGDLEANGGSGGIHIANNGNVTIGGVSGSLTGLQASNSAIKLTTTGTSAINVTEAINGGTGDVILSAGDDVIVEGGVLISATGTGTILLAAGGLLDLTATSQVTAADGNIDLFGDDITVNGGISASAGAIAFTLNDLGPTLGGTISINEMPGAGGGVTYQGGNGTFDKLTFAGIAGPVSLSIGSLSSLELLEGSSSNGDQINGPSAGAVFSFSGADEFTVSSTAVSGFENVVGGAGNDTFTFNPLSSLSGTLDGGGGSNELDYASFGAAISVNYQNNSATAITNVAANGFSNITKFAGNGLNAAFIGLTADTNYTITGENDFTFASVTVTDFGNLTGGAADDTFSFTSLGSLGGILNGAGGKANRLDYSLYDTGVIVDLGGGAATAIGNGIANLQVFAGSGNIDTITGPGSASTYDLTGPDSVTVGTFTVNGFENLIGGPAADRFIFHPGASISGTLDGGLSSTPVSDTLDYSLYGSTVAINLGSLPRSTAPGIAGGFTGINQFVGSAGTTDTFTGPSAGTSYAITAPNSFGSSLFQASGFENFSGGAGADTFVMGAGAALSGRLSGGLGTTRDTLSYSAYERPITVSIGPNTATGLGGGFADIESIIGTAFNDRFNFLNQATIDFVDGGGGTDLLEINDSNLSGNNTYTITSSSVSRNPVYTFQNFESLRLFLGRGDNVVNSGFFPFTQFIHGGVGFNTLNLPGVTSLNEGNPIRNVFHYDIDAPRSDGPDTGGLLKLQIDQRNQGALNPNQGFITENRFTIVDPGTLASQLGNLTGAFSAAVVAQAIIIAVEGNSYLVLRPFSLDGSGLTPSNLALSALHESLGVDANLELAAAIGYTGAIFLVNPDGPYSLDLSGVPVDPAILTLLEESLAIAAAAELSAALGLNLVAVITAADGIVPVALDGTVPDQAVTVILTGQLVDATFNELNAAIPAAN